MTSSKNNSLFQSRSDVALGAISALAAAACAAVVLLVAIFLLREAGPALSHIGFNRFLSDARWNPLEQSYALLPMLLATLLVAAGAVLIASPLGIAIAIFCHCYAGPRLARPTRGAIALLAGIPSVVYGLWGLTVLVPVIVEWRPPGASILAAVAVLAIMILPTIALLSDAALEAAPASYWRGAQALGLSPEATIIGVLLPAARSGIAASVLLASARALGETLAVLMVVGNVVQLPSSIFDPVRTLTGNIALEMAYAVGDHRSALFVFGLMLIAMATVLAVGAGRMRGAVIDG